MSQSKNPEAISKVQEAWMVWRQDDNGNRFVVERHLSREEALALVAELEAGGHKQLYCAVAETG